MALHYIHKHPYKPPFPAGLQTAVFAAGCFWGTEKGFWRLPGVYSTAVGFIGGHEKNPSYYDACSGKTGHTESTLVVFDPKAIAYSDLLRHFFACHDPTQGNRQGGDRGSQYRSGIFCSTDDQLVMAKACAAAFGEALSKKTRKKITTEIAKNTEFWYAEDQHQQYLAKPGSRQYCGAEPTGAVLPPMREWPLPSEHKDALLANHSPLLPPAFWAIYDGSIHAPHTPAVWDGGEDKAKKQAEAQQAAAEKQKAMLEAKFTIIIRYCGGCGFAPRANELAAYITAATGVEVGMLRDYGTTGNFDVRIKPDKAVKHALDSAGFFMAHSKKGDGEGAGAGFIDSMPKLEALQAVLVDSFEGVAVSKDVPPPKTAISEAPTDAEDAAAVGNRVKGWIEQHEVVILSKSFCPYCAEAKALLQAQEGITDVFAVELDQESTGKAIQAWVKAEFKHRTVPAIFLRQKFVGGCDDLKRMFAKQGPGGCAAM